MASIKFYIQKRNAASAKESAEIYRLIMSVSFSGKRIIIYPGITLRELEWDKANQKFSAFRKEQISLNAYLRKLETNSQNIFKSIQYKDGVVKPEFFRKQLAGLKLSPGIDFFDCYMEFLQQNYQKWSDSSYRKCKSLYQHLSSFRKVYSSKISLEGSDAAFMKEFADYLSGKGLNFFTVRGYINVFKWFLNWSLKEGHMINTSFKVFTMNNSGIEIGENNKTILFLSWEEMHHYFDFDFKDRKIAQVRDIFCFLAFSGLSCQEFQLLKRQDVFKDSIQIQGRNERLFVHNEFTRKILKRYENKYYRDNFLLPPYSTITINKYLRLGLKEAALERKIISEGPDTSANNNLSDRITISAARYTFVANCIHMGVRGEIISKWAGKIKGSLQEYIVTEIKNLEIQAVKQIDSYFEHTN